jgi:hypothetical protein
MMLLPVATITLQEHSLIYAIGRKRNCRYAQSRCAPLYEPIIARECALIPPRFTIRLLVFRGS